MSTSPLKTFTHQPAVDIVTDQDVLHTTMTVSPTTMPTLTATPTTMLAISTTVATTQSQAPAPTMTVSDIQALAQNLKDAPTPGEWPPSLDHPQGLVFDFSKNLLNNSQIGVIGMSMGARKPYQSSASLHDRPAVLLPYDGGDVFSEAMVFKALSQFQNNNARIKTLPTNLKPSPLTNQLTS